MFNRQQERHLGIAKRPKRQTPTKFPAENKPVNVYIHNIAKNEETNEVEVLYHVLVSGKPVAAVTAASDMRLVTDEEVSTELGFPIRTKAERKCIIYIHYLFEHIIHMCTIIIHLFKC